jgi:hypothetical protein
MLSITHEPVFVFSDPYPSPVTDLILSVWKMGVAGFVLRLYGFELDQDNTCEKDHALLCPSDKEQT